MAEISYNSATSRDETKRRALIASTRHTKVCEPVKGPAKWSLGREAVRLDRAFGHAKCGFGRGAPARPL